MVKEHPFPKRTNLHNLKCPKQKRKREFVMLNLATGWKLLLWFLNPNQQETVLNDWLDTPSRVSQSKDRKPTTRERNWVGTLFECIVGCKENVKYWDEGGNEFDKNLNLISTN